MIDSRLAVTGDLADAALDGRLAARDPRGVRDDHDVVVFCELADINVFQTVFGNIGEEVFQKSTLPRLSRTSYGNHREILGGLVDNTFYCTVEI